MDSGDRAGAIITTVIMIGLTAIIFLIGSCSTQESKFKYQFDKDVRIECIRQGGDWGRVSNPNDRDEYGCVKKK